MNKKTEAIIVTGASSGLGAAIAHQLGRVKANVVITARRASALEHTAERVRNAGGQVRIVPGDITELETVNTIIQTAIESFGGIRTVINNAGKLDPIAMLENADVDDWKATFDVNFFAPLRLIREALPHLRACDGNGRVINVSSGAAVHGYPTWGAYGASKAAINHLTQSISAEEPDIVAVALRPGVVDTPMQRQIREDGKDVMPEQLYERFSSLYETGELLDPALPGFAAAVLALHAPPDWSGEFMNWNNEYVRRLCERCERVIDEGGIPHYLTESGAIK